MPNLISPPKSRSSSGPRAVVIGAGVSGLTTARCLQQRGFAVTVIADRFQSATTSVVAGALWEWPPAVCGYYEMQPEQSLLAEQRWCVESYNCFKVLARQLGTGVSFRPVIFYLETPAEENPLELRKMRELREHVGGFLHSADLATRPGINAMSTFVDAYTYETPWWTLTSIWHGCRVRCSATVARLSTCELMHRSLLLRPGCGILIVPTLSSTAPASGHENSPLMM